jgi:hypothetical protein
MPHLMEVPVPVRFIFVLFTPDFSPNMDFHEVGRSFCTLMSHKVRFTTWFVCSKVPFYVIFIVDIHCHTLLTIKCRLPNYPPSEVQHPSCRQKFWTLINLIYVTNLLTRAVSMHHLESILLLG